MTRRNFLQVFTGAVSAGLGFVCWMAKKAVPRRFTRAARHRSYPGPVKSLSEIDNVGKWSG
ncbi:MAG: hypothetical protein DRP65_08100 [Planctomycetota bacterium]|nr:MAG: hypothetical protein DRP65_08100 [Planctomycetota bacterium]